MGGTDIQNMDKAYVSSRTGNKEKGGSFSEKDGNFSITTGRFWKVAEGCYLTDSQKMGPFFVQPEE